MGKYSELGVVEMWQLILEKLDELIEASKPCVTETNVASEPTYIEPTDEHAKSRPMVEVRDCEDEFWRERTLVFVAENTDFPFYAINAHRDDVVVYRFCRMKVEA